MILNLTAPTLTASLILFAGVIDDFRTRKFHNWLFIVCSLVAVTVIFATHGFIGVGLASAGFVAGILIFLPLVLLKVVGAGDMKIMAAFGIVAGWNSVINVMMFALVWGALFGLVQVALKGELVQMFQNIRSIAVNKGKAKTELHSIPFTAALFLGWLTDLVYQGLI